MATQFEAIVEIDRPIDDVFAYLADGENDRDFSPRVQKIEKTPAGPTVVGTTFRSTVKDAGMTTQREFAITELVAPTRVRWQEKSKNIVAAADGGYDLEATGNGGTRVRIYNVLEGHGIGKLLVGFAAKAARKDAPAFGLRIKKAVEAAVPAA
ncbi:SRPBCC family protein [Streptomyces sp. NPDC060184]|uniref:SRPBCC family protein n=1 Tax=Streptomyces sp. NPDC060184 TaxID=3347064 RepID=UPI00365368D0